MASSAGRAGFWLGFGCACWWVGVPVTDGLKRRPGWELVGGLSFDRTAWNWAGRPGSWLSGRELVGLGHWPYGLVAGPGYFFWGVVVMRKTGWSGQADRRSASGDRAVTPWK
ncbi:hypothetical protein ScoT_57290 [Streptomyces albidoflavus]|uniref:Uncharacterized protein n=1 Tax=Streptomyces albidoflavus TaxID=1886 RepID=A0AA37C2Y7_9ACTN|nr:hypothetical protein ScoT_57290 [Streptomyces albidoflavus]